jgi:hypothetical protein
MRAYARLVDLVHFDAAAGSARSASSKRRRDMAAPLLASGRESPKRAAKRARARGRRLSACAISASCDESVTSCAGIEIERRRDGRA